MRGPNTTSISFPTLTSKFTETEYVYIFDFCDHSYITVCFVDTRLCRNNNLMSDNVFLTIVDPKVQEDDDSGNCQFIVVRNVESKNLATRKQNPISHNKLIDIKREEKRRVTHNEVERRRRVKINNWIGQLKELMDGKAPSVDTHTSDSKSQILVKACDYIKDINMQLER